MDNILSHSLYLSLSSEFLHCSLCGFVLLNLIVRVVAFDFV